SGMPVVLIESDRERLSDEKTHVKSFDWDELKTAYNGRSVRARGMATSGNETYEPPFRGSIVISQNNDVNASVPILQRIVHLHFDKAGQNPTTRAAAMSLESMPVESVSGFILAATKREAKIMNTILERTEYRERQLQQVPKVRTMRIAKNHGQLLALADALRHVVRLTDEQFEAIECQVIDMAIEREEAISADHPLVQEFWEAYEYLNGADDTAARLNHSRDPQFISINLNHFVQVATEARQQIPPIRDLKKVLKSSKRHKFDGIRVVNSAIRSQAAGLNTTSPSVRCWVFQKGAV
ncbi:MAG: bifunctional DNA primase/helicase, partial [Pigmentiphaga sp.]